MLSFINFNGVLKRGCRIALRAKVNDSLISGIRLIDSVLPVGRGQRQLILGDRYTGKTSLFLSFLISSHRFNLLGVIDGFGTKRLFSIYIGINQNLSKLSKLIDYLIVN
jgi:F-type H+-transporting ATPase subunit alpha